MSVLSNPRANRQPRLLSGFRLAQWTLPSERRERSIRLDVAQCSSLRHKTRRLASKPETERYPTPEMLAKCGNEGSENDLRINDLLPLARSEGGQIVCYFSGLLHCLKALVHFDPKSTF
jgi:hypothetical protein